MQEIFESLESDVTNIIKSQGFDFDLDRVTKTERSLTRRINLHLGTESLKDLVIKIASNDTGNHVCMIYKDTSKIVSQSQLYDLLGHYKEGAHIFRIFYEMGDYLNAYNSRHQIILNTIGVKVGFMTFVNPSTVRITRGWEVTDYEIASEEGISNFLEMLSYLVSLTLEQLIKHHNTLVETIRTLFPHNVIFFDVDNGALIRDSFAVLNHAGKPKSIGSIVTSSKVKMVFNGDECLSFPTLLEMIEQSIMS